MRVLALDLGEKRVGAALSDELGLTAGPLTTLDRKPTSKFLDQVGELVEKHRVERIVLGLPRNMDGSMGPQAQRVMSMVQELKKRLDVEIDTWDERLSTAAVERVLLEADLSRRKRKKVVDKAAAAYILQGYLDYQRGREAENGR